MYAALWGRSATYIYQGVPMLWPVSVRVASLLGSSNNINIQLISQSMSFKPRQLASLSQLQLASQSASQSASKLYSWMVSHDSRFVFNKPKCSTRKYSQGVDIVFVAKRQAVASSEGGSRGVKGDDRG